MLRDDQDIDDEISSLYMQKDIHKFWKKWTTKFSNKQCTPSVIYGVSGDMEASPVSHKCRTRSDLERSQSFKVLDY